MRYLSRRRFLANSALVGSTLSFTRASSALEYGGGRGVPWQAGFADLPNPPVEGGFLSPGEREAVEALTARLIPSDDNGPGARDADVMTFIDRQLAGFYGRGQRWYMEGPFPEALETQGYQSPYAPASLWREGLAALESYCRTTHDGRSFAELDETEQDGVLSRLAEGEISFETVDAKQFFDFAREMTIEGFFSDPIYGGNRDMVGWQLVGFPGARYDYRDFIHHNGAPLDLAPVSLMGRPGWRSE
jgi:gluconate 2-dehydrogenase gamma chain